MIRIRSTLYKISFALILILFSVITQAQTTMGARELGLGKATTALVNSEWGIFSNPALLYSESLSVGFYGLRNYGFAEITDMAAFGTQKTSLGIAGLGFHRYGDALFSETRIRAAYKNEYSLLHYGLVLNYNHLSFGADYGSGGALGVDVGLAAEITERWWIGAVATNVNFPAYSFQNGDEELPRLLQIGMSYQLEEHALFLFDVVKDVRFPVSYRSGIEMKVIDNLKGRIGISTEPVSYSFGLGYGKEMWTVNLALEQHKELGSSPGFDLLFRF